MQGGHEGAGNEVRREKMTKTLLVTGASSEVGMELLREVGLEYGMIYAQYRNMNDGLAELVEELGGKTEILPIKADLSKQCEVGVLVKKILDAGSMPCHIVHLAAPKVRYARFHNSDWKDWDNAWEVSLHSIVTILQAFLPEMEKVKHGRIVFLLTSNTAGRPDRYVSDYVAVKYALLGLMRALAAEYAEKGITVNGISPGMMETGFLSELPHFVVEQNAEKSPLGRNIRISEILPIFRYMLSDEGAAMNGENIPVLGGA